jgi:hypothetical protein
MVMIVKDHEKQAHGFISVTRPARQPADLWAVDLRRVRHAGCSQLAAVEGGPWPLPCPWIRNARTFALGLHPSEQ